MKKDDVLLLFSSLLLTKHIVSFLREFLFGREWSNEPDWEQISKVVASIPGYASNFSTPDCKKINKAPSARVIVFFSDFYKVPWVILGVYSAPNYWYCFVTESICRQIIPIILCLIEVTSVHALFWSSHHSILGLAIMSNVWSSSPLKKSPQIVMEFLKSQHYFYSSELVAEL